MENKFIMLLDIIIIALVSARVSRLITTDTITQRFRDHYIDLVENEWVVRDTLFAKFIHCNWCVGFWVTVALTPIYYLLPYSQFVFIVVAASYIQGLINSLEKE